jgi:hypothetical protein
MWDGRSAAKARWPKALALNHAVENSIGVDKIIFSRDNR